MRDLLSCPNCGELRTDGEFCNLTCRRAWLNKINLMWRQGGETPLTSITAQDVDRLFAEYEEFESQSKAINHQMREERKVRIRELLKIVSDNEGQEPGWMYERLYHNLTGKQLLRNEV